MTIRRLLSSSDLAEKDSFGQTEPLNLDKLESAVARQSTGHGENQKYNTIEEIAATLFYGVVMNHAFENGNERTGLITLLIFLDQNLIMLIDVDEDALFEFTRSVAAYEIKITNEVKRDSDAEVEAIAKWISDHTRDKVLGERPTRFSDNKSILENFGCTFKSPKRNCIKARIVTYMTHIGYPRQVFELSIEFIKKIRRDLHLSESVTSFVNSHRNLLKRLADL